MKFIDETKIEVQAGKGGNGIISFRKELKVPRGGPDGGSGGDGGSVYFVGHMGMNTLLNVATRRKVVGNNGVNGKTKRKQGANGADVFVSVPLGTIVYRDQKIIANIVEEKPYLIAKGGPGGRGNFSFKSSINTAPRISENGLPGEAFVARLELKVLADVGLVGLPSAGKSTLLGNISNANPKVGAYDFTTITPNLGLVKASYDADFVIADLPGLIEGASQGKGLGFQFLRHIERCRVIAHVIDFGSERANPVDAYKVILNELHTYKLGLEKRATVIIANKKDLPNFEANKAIFARTFPELKVVETSALTKDNLGNLKITLWETLQHAPSVYEIDPIVGDDEMEITLQSDIQVRKINSTTFEIFGSDVRRVYDLIPLNSHENFLRFNHKLKLLGVWDMLTQEGVHEGDQVRIFDYQFVWGEENA